MTLKELVEDILKKTTPKDTSISDGQLGIPDAQINWGTQFVATSKFSLQANREFDTFKAASNYVFNDETSFPGIIITVSADENPSNNGAYLVEIDNDKYNEGDIKIPLKMTKLGTQEELEWINLSTQS